MENSNLAMLAILSWACICCEATTTSRRSGTLSKTSSPDEPPVIQFFDSESVGKKDRVVGTPHGSPESVGGGDELRQSVEVRYLTVW